LREVGKEEAKKDSPCLRGNTESQKVCVQELSCCIDSGKIIARCKEDSKLSPSLTQRPLSTQERSTSGTGALKQSGKTLNE
jgi:hypothetical protein